MGYTSRDRDRGRLAVTAVTAIGSVGALTATGWLMGVAASDFAAQQAPTDADTAGDQRAGASHSRSERRRGDARTRGGLRVRPYVTRVTVQYVTTTGDTSTVPGPGPSIVPDSGDAGSSSGPGSSGSSSGPGPAPAAPAPEAPAPSSGS